MAAGMWTKQADQLTARRLNDVNDSVAGGAIVSLPAGITGPAVSATQAGDRIVLDDATALALSDTTVGTLYGGVYEYVGTLSTSTASPQRGACAFWRTNELPGGATQSYVVTADAQPSTTNPSLIAGVFISAPTKGNYCWIQIAGTASCLFDSSLTGTLASGAYVTPKGAAGTAASVASTFDSNPAVATPGSAAVANSQVNCAFGVAIAAPVASSISTVLITRGLGCGRV